MVDRRWRFVGAAAVVAISLAGCNSGEGQPVTVLRGKTTAVNDVRTSISWHQNGIAPCLEKPPPQPIEMGVIESASYEDAPGKGVVVWLKCL